MEKQQSKKKKKISKAKIKGLKEESIIEAFEKDCVNLLKVKVDCGLDTKSQKCKKCDFESSSEGLLRRHKVKDHNLKETFRNIILCFEFDLHRHEEILKAIGEDINTTKCDQCDHKTSGEGKLSMHKTNNHENGQVVCLCCS